MNVSDSIFSKDNQSKLFENYREALTSVWGKDTRMIDYCMKQAILIIPLSDNYLLPVEKERIETEFWFGYSDIGQGRSQQENDELVSETNDNLVEYFMNRNLERVNRILDMLKDIPGDSYKKLIKVNNRLHADNAKYIICDIHVYDPWHNTYNGDELTTEEINIAIEGYKLYKEKFEKRLETYLKKYDTSKLSLRTYWIDE